MAFQKLAHEADGLVSLPLCPERLGEGRAGRRRDHILRLSGEDVPAGFDGLVGLTQGGSQERIGAGPLTPGSEYRLRRSSRRTASWYSSFLGFFSSACWKHSRARRGRFLSI